MPFERFPTSAAATRPLARVGRAMRSALLVALNTFILFALANIAADLYLRRERPTVSDEDRRRARGDAALARYGIEFYRRVYPDSSDEQILQLLHDQPELKAAYEPFAEFRSAAIATPTMNIHQAGFRLVGARQGPWPLDDKAVNIFVFGGSTTLGSGVEDDKTIPAVLQSILREGTGNGEIRVNVYNFGVGASFSSQELAYFQNQVRYGHVPDIVVFIDGLNDFFFWDGDPSHAKSSRQMFHLLRMQSRQLGRDEGVAWHVVELLKSLPVVKLAHRLTAAESSPMPGGNSPQRRPDSAVTARKASNPIEPVPGTSASDIYAAKYADEPLITDPRRIKAVITRYLVNKTFAQGIASQLGIEAIFAWQPVPTYKFDLAYHPFTIVDGHRRSRYGYPVMAQHVATHDMGANFAWCADIQDGIKRLLYIDQVHYNEDGSQRVADCIARTILASGALERAQRRVSGRMTAAANGTEVVATAAIARRPARLIARLFGERAITQDLDLSKPLREGSDTATGGVRLADASVNFGSVYEYVAIDPASTERTFEVSVRIKPDTSDYLGLVFTCLGGQRPESQVMFINPQTMGVILATGFHELVPEPGGWVRVALAGTCRDPAHDRLQVMLYPEHGDAANRGAIIFGGGEVARVGDAPG
jgi:lysophospholipase L1-like esterase